MFRRGGIAADCIYCIIKTNPAVGHNTITGSRRLDDVVVACRCQGPAAPPPPPPFPPPQPILPSTTAHSRRTRTGGVRRRRNDADAAMVTIVTVELPISFTLAGLN